MKICETCDNAVTVKAVGRTSIDYCEAALNKPGKMTYDNVPDGCPLPALKKDFQPGDSRAQKFISEHPIDPLLMKGDKFYPMVYNDNNKPVLRCTRNDGYIKECDAVDDEDCYDCWDKEYKEKEHE